MKSNRTVKWQIDKQSKYKSVGLIWHIEIYFRVETGSDGTAQLPEFVLKKTKTFEYSTDSLSSSLDESLNQVSS